MSLEMVHFFAVAVKRERSDLSREHLSLNLPNTTTQTVPVASDAMECTRMRHDSLIKFFSLSFIASFLSIIAPFMLLILLPDGELTCLCGQSTCKWQPFSLFGMQWNVVATNYPQNNRERPGHFLSRDKNRLCIIT